MPWRGQSPSPGRHFRGVATRRDASRSATGAISRRAPPDGRGRGTGRPESRIGSRARACQRLDSGIDLVKHSKRDRSQALLGRVTRRIQQPDARRGIASCVQANRRDISAFSASWSQWPGAPVGSSRYVTWLEGNALTCVKRASRFRLVLRATPAVGALALTAALCAPPAGGADYLWPVTRVIDGDTVKVDVGSRLPPELSKLSVRLRGVDTPGIRCPVKCPAKCMEEKKAGRAAAEFAEAQIRKAKRIVVRDPKWGKYSGRVIADLMLDGKSLSSLLIAEGHGRPYDSKRRWIWCR